MLFRSIFDENKLLNVFTKIDLFSESLNTSIKNLLDENSVGNKNLNKAFIKIRKYKEILTELSELSFVELYKKAEEESGQFYEDNRKNSLDIIRESIELLNTSLINDNTDKSITRLNTETNSLDKFVRAVNKIDITKTTRLTNLMNALSNLAEKIGGFDKLVDALNGEFSKVISELSTKIDDTNKTIHDAKEFEKDKMNNLRTNIRDFKDILDKPMTINVGKLNDDGTVDAGYEKTKK